MASKKISKTSKIVLDAKKHLHIVMEMLKYQEKNKIASNCLANTFYLKHLLAVINVKANIKAVLACRKRGDVFTVVNHVILEFEDGTYCDPSWEIFSQEFVYLDSYKQFVEYSDDYYQLDKDTKKDCLEKFLWFTTRAKQLNEGDGIGNKFVDYIMKQHRFVCKMTGIDEDVIDLVQR